MVSQDWSTRNSFCGVVLVVELYKPPRFHGRKIPTKTVTLQWYRISTCPGPVLWFASRKLTNDNGKLTIWRCISYENLWIFHRHVSFQAYTFNCWMVIMGGSGRDLISIDLRFWNPRKSAAWQSEGYAHWKQHHWGLVEVFLKSYDDLNSGFFNVVEHVCTGYIYTCLAYSLFQIHLLNKSSRPNFRSIFCGGFLIPNMKSLDVNLHVIF